MQPLIAPVGRRIALHFIRYFQGTGHWFDMMYKCLQMRDICKYSGCAGIPWHGHCLVIFSLDEQY